jgi:hypothetical protein
MRYGVVDRPVEKAGRVRVDGNGSSWIDDEVTLMALVADALNEVPAWVASTGRAVYTWRYIDAELATLASSTTRIEGAHRNPDDEGTATITDHHEPRGRRTPRPRSASRGDAAE